METLVPQIGQVLVRIGQTQGADTGRQGQPPTTEAHNGDTIFDQQSHAPIERDEVSSDTEIAVLEQVPPPVFPDSTVGTEIALLEQEAAGGSELALG